MYRVTRRSKFEYAHRLLGHPGACKFVHGHSGEAIVTVEAETVDAQGMVIDFGILKKHINEVIDTWDHAIILQKGDPLIPLLRSMDQRVVEIPDPPTAEILARILFNILAAQGLRVVEVSVRETENNFATVRFS